MNRRRPIILGIVGDSAAGKSTLTRGIVNILGADRVTHVCTDDYHKYDRKERAERNITALHPECNYIDVMELHLERLHYGQPILKPVYDHATGTLVRPQYLVPKEFVIVEGLLGFSTPVARNFFDVKVYLDPPEPVRTQWKINRDTSRRGYTREQVLGELEKREHDSAAYIRSQRQYADIVVQFVPPPGSPADYAGPNLNARMVLRPTLDHPDLSYLVDDSRNANAEVRLELARDQGRPADVLEIDHRVTPQQATLLENAIWDHIPDLRPVREDEFGEFYNPSGRQHSGQLALVQLLLTYHLLKKYRDVENVPFAAPVAALRQLNTSMPSVLAAS